MLRLVRSLLVRRGLVVPQRLLYDLADTVTVPAHQATGTPQEGTGAITPAWPTHAIDDIGLLIATTGGTEPASLTTANGFVAVADSPQDAGVAATSGVCVNTWWCRATSTSMASPVIADSGNHQYGLIVTFRNCVKTGDPWDVTVGDVLSTLSTSVTLPGDTTTRNGCLIVGILGHTVDDVQGAPQLSGWANADLTGITEIYDDSTNVAAGSGMGIFTGVKLAAGAFGATTATLATTSRQARLVIALRSY